MKPKIQIALILKRSLLGIPLVTLVCAFLLSLAPLANGAGQDAATLESAVKAIAGESQTLFLESGTWNLATSVTIPENVSLKLADGAVFYLDESVTLKIEGAMEVTGLPQLFFGKGVVRFGDKFLKEVFPQWWGSNSSVDDTAACQAALDSGAETVRFPRGQYLIDVVGAGGDAGLGLRPASNTILIFDRGAVLQAISTDRDDYTVLDIRDRENVTIDGATILGERDTHSGEGGEWGHGIRIRGSSRNIIVKNCSVSGMWGDGIYLGEGCPDGVYVENSKFDRNRRNGCSIISARNVLFKNCSFSNSNGTSPFKGVDIEPNVASDILSNIVFEDCHSFENICGGFSLARDDGQDLPVSVTFRGCVSENDGYGFGMDIGPSDCAGILFISDCVVINPKENGFRTVSANLRVKIDGLYIYNPNQKNDARLRYGSGFAVFNIAPHHEGKTKLSGNVDAKNVYVFSDDDKALYAFYLESDLGEKGGLKDLNISLSTNMPNEKRFSKGPGPYVGYCNVAFPDQPENAVSNSQSGLEMDRFIDQKLTNRGATGEVSFSLDGPNAMQLDSSYTFEVMAQQKMTIKADVSSIRPGTFNEYSSAEIGARLKVQFNGKNWVVREQIGTWTQR